MRLESLGLFVGLSVLVGACGGGVEAPPPETQQTAPVQAPSVPLAVSINALMVDWVDHSAHALWNVELEGQAPKDDKSWREVERHATQLAAAGSLIALGGTGQADPGWAQQPAWKTYSRQLTDAGLAAFTAARNRNLAEVVNINGRLLEACESCHKEYKPDSPTEGRIHDPE